MSVFRLPLLLIFFVLLTTTSSTAFAASKKKTLILKSDPPRALVTLRRTQDDKKIKQCKTPCKVKVKNKYAYRLSYLKRGYGDRTIYLDDNSKWSLVDDILIELPFTRYKSDRQIAACERANREVGTEDQLSKLCWIPPPNMPHKVKIGGHCKFTYDVLVTGDTENVKLVSCSDNIFEDNARLSLLKAEFTPKQVNNIPVAHIGKEMTISFRKNAP